MQPVATREILEVISNISNTSLYKINSFSEEICNELKLCKHISKRLQARPGTLKIPKHLDNTSIDKIEEVCRKNKDFVEKVQTFTKELKERTNDLEKVHTEAEKEIHTLEQKVSHLNAKQKSFQKKRDKILVYKLLTNTHFCYETKNVKGYVLGKTPTDIKSFDFNSQKMSQKEIVEALYTTIKKLYCASPKAKENENTI